MITELTAEENIVLECAQEADRKPSVRSGMIDADDVVAYAGDNEIAMTKNRATTLLSRLTGWGMLRREPRASRGWGQGWHAVKYSLTDSARISA